MRIKVKNMNLSQVMALKRPKHQKPIKTRRWVRRLLKALSASELSKVHFSYRSLQMERLGKEEPCLILMNHSSFIDLKIAVTLFQDRPLNIVCTSDGFVGKNWLMRRLGCIPTQKFVTDVTLLKDMVYAVSTLKSSVLLYPEASYSFDGTATPLPPSVGKCLKLLKVPVVMVRTYGAFAHDPLYNNLQQRQVDVSAEVEYLLSPEDIQRSSVQELNQLLKERFTFDNFKWQQENQIRITEPFRADALNRVLYKCPHCQTEGRMIGRGIYLTCMHCHKRYELTEYGRMQALKGPTEFSHIPDWYRWERACVKEELLQGTYRLEVWVAIYMLVDHKSMYKVGTGKLIHTQEGFHLTGCNGALDYFQKPQASYSLYADYFWYEIGDMVCIGDKDHLYYCLPLNHEDIAAKTRLAAEELYQLVTQKAPLDGKKG